MSSPDAPPPFAPIVPPTAPPPQPYAAPQPSVQPSVQPYAQPAPTAAPWAPPPPRPGASPALAIVALVVAVLALLVAVATLVLALSMSGAFDSSYQLTGTAPQVVEGQPYSGTLLARELQRLLRDDGSDVGDLTCPDTPRVDSDATTTCSGKVDGWASHLSVDFQDGEGHFVLSVEDAG